MLVISRNLGGELFGASHANGKRLEPVANLDALRSRLRDPVKSGTEIVQVRPCIYIVENELLCDQPMLGSNRKAEMLHTPKSCH
jgi:hypothetical protein